MMSKEMASKEVGQQVRVDSNVEDSPPPSKHDIDGDQALQVVGVEASEVVIDEATNRRLLRKIDKMMMPVSRAQSYDG